MAGMSEDSGTRSALLWQVRRLLNETAELPQILMMENVPQVHSKKNLADFQKWLDYLESRGYSNYYQDLNANDYGMAQSRNRTIMFSILGNYRYEFPKPIPLTTCIKDYLEEEVDEKYYLNNQKAKELIDKLVLDGKITKPSIECVDLCCNQAELVQTANCITARYDAGIRNHKNEASGVVKCEKIKVIGQMDNTKDHTLESANRVYDTDGIAPTIPTACGGGHIPKVMCIAAMRGRDQENSNYRGPANENFKQVLEPRTDGCTNTITTVQKDNLVLETQATNYKGDWVWEIDGELYRIRIRKLTPRECWRLMGFTDEDFDKAQAVNSNTQLYKQAGNSIVKNVLMECYKMLF